MADRASDEDLGALLSRATRRLVEEERPLLAARGLTMWGYIALSRLAEAPASSQLKLAAAMGYDKTRLIALLDDLESDGLVRREPDPSDRRARVISLTAAGRKRHAAARRAIGAMENRVLGDLGDADRRRLRRALAALAAG
jgi:DNA-binding MarR family transcriptional regulator